MMPPRLPRQQLPFAPVAALSLLAFAILVALGSAPVAQTALFA